MICPECEKAKLESRVYEEEMSTTLVGYQPYWDCNGVYHNHNRNDVKVAYRCDNGHEWIVMREKSCPNCDWKG